MMHWNKAIYQTMGVKLETQLCCSKQLTNLIAKLRKVAMEESSSTETSKQTIQHGQVPAERTQL